MDITRRVALRHIGVGAVGLGTASFGLYCSRAGASEPDKSPGEARGVLVDTSACVGCRKCEFACKEAAGFDTPPLAAYEEKSVFAQARRPEPTCYTVINEHDVPGRLAGPLYTKVNCMHCQDPACVSACLVGALRKESGGEVSYDASKCMGCRYCMVACPFQIPTYDYNNALTPQVRKCTLCAERIAKEGGVPACVKICPQECLTYGKRADLLELARERIRRRPDNYVAHIYGEDEVGGTSWLYLSDTPFEQAGFLTLGSTPPHGLTESIQHGIFKHWVPPVAWAGLLSLIMWLTKPERTETVQVAADSCDCSATQRRRRAPPIAEGVSS